MGIAKLSMSLLALAGSVIAADLQPIEAKVRPLPIQNDGSLMRKLISDKIWFNTGIQVFLQERNPVLHEGCCLPAGSWC